MPEQVQAKRARVALVFGDAGAAGHLRETVAEHVDVVYATSAADFDSTRLKESGATAALVNLDAFDLLDAIAARLNEAGVAVVFNDPEISSSLEGWERARWLRHLTAKLSGSSNYDPPRPAHETAPPAAPTTTTEPVAASPSEPVIAERPLSSAEIESMTADFVAPSATHAAKTVDASPAQPEAGTSAGFESVTAIDLPELDVAPPAGVSDAEPPSAHDVVHAEAALADEPVDTAALDIDTEALSAMIDARLAEAEPQAPIESGEAAWQVQASSDVAASDSIETAADPVTNADPTSAADIAVPASETAPAPPPTAEDDELALGMPALGDWHLLDPDAPVETKVEAKSASRKEPTISMDFAGLELVPMEAQTPIELHSEPVEHRLYEDGRKQSEATGKKTLAQDSDGDQA